MKHAAWCNLIGRINYACSCLFQSWACGMCSNTVCVCQNKGPPKQKWVFPFWAKGYSQTTHTHTPQQRSQGHRSTLASPMGSSCAERGQRVGYPVARPGTMARLTMFRTPPEKRKGVPFNLWVNMPVLYQISSLANFTSGQCFRVTCTLTRQNVTLAESRPPYHPYPPSHKGICAPLSTFLSSNNGHMQVKAF